MNAAEGGRGVSGSALSGGAFTCFRVTREEGLQDRVTLYEPLQRILRERRRERRVGPDGDSLVARCAVWFVLMMEEELILQAGCRRQVDLICRIRAHARMHVLADPRLRRRLLALPTLLIGCCVASQKSVTWAVAFCGKVSFSGRK